VSQEGRFIHRVSYCLFLVLSFFVSLLSRRAMIRTGKFVGGLAYRLWRERREIARENLDHAFGETKTPEEKEKIARESFRGIGATLLELAWGVHRMNEKVFSEIVVVEGVELLRSAATRGKGAILLPAHFGNWEVMASSFGYLREFGAHYVAKRLKNPYLDKMANDYRCRGGNTVIHMNGATKKIVEALEKGHMVGTVLDQKVPIHRGGVLVDFFGRPASVTPLVAELHLDTLAPIVLVRCYPEEGGKCRLVFGPEIDFRPSGDREADVRDLTQTCMDTWESYIREAPQFWIWGHKMWKLDRG
jgi:KDO2-lipid IV(A) lauroyltransferase